MMEQPVQRKNINRGYQKLRVWQDSIVHSCYESFHLAKQISDADYRELDELHYKLENELLRLISSRQKKQVTGE